YDVVLLASGAVQIRRVVGGIVTVLAQSTPVVTDLRGSFATLTLRATGAGPVTLSAAANGATILTTTDGSAAALQGAGYAGLWTSSAGVVFDNFMLTSASMTPPPADMAPPPVDLARPPVDLAPPPPPPDLASGNGDGLVTGVLFSDDFHIPNNESSLGPNW